MSQNLLRDLRYAGRTLANHPGFTAVAVVSLAFGIGVNSAIFSLIDALLLKSLPVADPGRLVLLSDPTSAGVSIGTQTGVRDLFTYEEFQSMRERNKVFTGMLAAESSAQRLNVNIDGGSLEEMQTRLVSGDYFATLGVKPLAGRTFTLEEDKAPGADPYVVISYAYWKKRFGLDAAALGKTIQIHQTFFTIIGVAPPGFFGETVGQPPDAWIPMMMEPLAKPGRGDWLHDDRSKTERVEWLLVAGRLKPGVTETRAEASVNVLFQQVIHETTGSNLRPDTLRALASQKIKIQPGSKGASPLRDQFNQPLLVLMTVVGLVLLIACVNVANLLLARSASRQREVGIRLAIGASRARLVRQLLTESMLLAVAGGAAGILVAFWASQLLLRMVSSGPNPVPLDIQLDARMLAFTAGVSILTGLVFGLAPAFRATRVDVCSTLKDNSRSVTGGGRVSLGKSLVVSQVAISLVLLIGAGLFLRTLQNLDRVDLGYPREKLLLVRIDALDAGYQDPQRAAVYQTLAERFRALPGVRAVTYSENGLFSGTESMDQITAEGYKPQKRDEDHARFDQIGPGYFSTIGVPMLLGREIDPQDAGNAPHVCVINEALARTFFAGRNPIGKHLTDEFPDTRTTFEIVGVSKDDRDHRLRGETPPRFYIPLLQGLGEIPPAANFELRTFADPNSIVRMVRQQVEQVDRNLPILSVRPLGELLDQSLTRERLLAQLCGFFAALALLLASVGLYGVLSYSVARRTNEIGIRMALGAQQGSVLSMVLRETAVVVAAGIAIGVPVSFALTRLVSSRLYGLKASDPLTILAASVLLAAVAMLSGYLPARRASRVDPLVALRYE